MRGRGLIALLAWGAAVAVSGCIQTSAIRARAAADFGCPEDRIALRDLGGGAYRARGCNSYATYVCTQERTGGSTCIRNSEVTETPRGSDAPIGVEPETEWARSFAWTHGPTMRHCVGDHAVFVVEFEENGRASGILPFAGETAEMRRCLASALMSDRLDEGPGDATAIRFDMSPGEASPPTASAPSGPPAAPAQPVASSPAAAGADPRIAASVRTALDAHAEDVLTCTGTARAAVHVEWAAQAVPRLSLGGDLAGTPAEECVRAAIGDRIAIPAGARAGVVVHLVRRTP